MIRKMLQNFLGGLKIIRLQNKKVASSLPSVQNLCLLKSLKVGGAFDCLQSMHSYPTHVFERRNNRSPPATHGTLEHWNIGTLEHWNIGTCTEERCNAQHAQLIIFGLVWMKSWDCLYENCDDVGSMIQRCQGD